MMDFNLILLIAGLGLLASVLLFALWGFLGGLKRELSCIAVFIVLLVLSWLVFGDAATFLNANVGQQVANILDIQGESITTLWDAILEYAKNVIPNGEALLVEGKETYSLFYSIVATVCRAAGLVIGTIAILIICPIIRLITHIIGLIIRGVKKRKAKKLADENITQEEKKPEEVTVASFDGGEEAVVTKTANEIPAKTKGKRRIWGAVAGALKGVFVVILLCAPLSGLSAILNSATPETKELLSNLVDGKAEIKVENTNNVADMAFDFAEAYENSGLGKFANASSFFFKESFSEKLFDKLLTMETKTQTISLSDEIKEFIDAANALEGNVDFSKVSETQFKDAVEALKDSKLTTELMPVAIEYAYEIASIQRLLVDANQTDAFLDLRYNDWRKDIDAVLDAVKEAYDLNLFPIAEFEVLGMNVNELREVTNILGDTEIMNDALPIGLAVALKLDVAVNTFGELEMPEIDDYDLKKELNSIVDIYAKVQILDLATEYKLGSNESIRDILGDSAKVNLLFDIIHDVIELQLVEKLAIPAAFGFLENNIIIRALFEEAGEFENLMALENEFTLDDLLIYVDAIKIALNLVDLSEYPTIGFNYLQLDPDKLDEVITQLFSTEITPKVFDMTANVVLNMDSIKNFENGLLTDLDLTGFDWEKELKTFVNIYRSFLELQIESEEELKGDVIELLQGILEDDTKFGALTTILTSVVDTQIYDLIGSDAIQHYIEKFVDKNYEAFADIIDVTVLSKEEWKEDIVNILEMAQIANELNVLDSLNPFDYTQLDLVSDEGITNIKDLISHIFDLNILGDDELKTELLMASINQFNWTIVDEEFDSSNIDWDVEEQVLLNLVDVYKKINDLEEFDIYNLKSIDHVALLENDLFLDYVVEALEIVVDSNLVLELLPGLLDKYVLPKLDDINGVDDETLFNDLFNNLPSEELVNEIIKLVDVLRAAVDMNLLRAKENLGNVDIANTEALKTIISGILDSKIIQGYEGRIIRIILKLTGILDIPKDSLVYEELVNLDYTGEKEVLLAFVDAITPVLKDSTFKLVNEDNKLILDLNFWADDVNAQTLLEGFKVLFGTYEDSTGGSKLIEVLIPNIYDKFIEEKNLIPDDFKEVVDILDVTNATGATIVNDLRCVIYILEQLVAIDAQTLLNGGDFVITSDAVVEAVGNIIDALHDMQLFEGNESETLAWIVNFAADKLKVEIDEVTTEFDSVDWDGQTEVYKDIVKDIVSLLKDNNLITYGDVVNFIQNKEYNSTTYINKANATAILDILDKVIDVEVIDAIIPLIVKYGVKVINEKGFDLGYINDLTNEQLVEDFHQLVAIAHVLVEDVDLVSYYVENFKGNMPLPNEEGLLKAIDEIFELNIITEADGKLATVIYNKIIEKVIPQDKEFILDISDFSFSTIDWSTEKEVIKGLVSVAYDLLEVNNILTMENLQLMITEKWYTDPVILRKETGHVAADALRVIKDSQILQNVIEKLYNYGMFVIADSQMLPFDISYLNDMPKELLAADLGTLADILDLAVDFGVLEYITDKDIRNMDIELVAQMIEKLYDLNLVQAHEVELFTDIFNYVLYLATNKTSYNFYLTQSQVEEMDMRAEFVNLANVVRSLQGFLDAKEVDNLNDLLLIVNNASYKNKEFFDKDTYSSLIDVAKTALDLQVVELLIPQIMDFVVYVSDAKGSDLSFLTNGDYTTELVLEDLDTILEIARTAYDFGVIDYVFEKTLYTIETEVLCDILDQVATLNILNLYFHDLLAVGVNAGFKLAKLDITVEKEDFADVVLADDINELKDVIRVVKDLLNEKEIVSLNDLEAFIGMGEHKKEACYDVATGEILASLLTEIADVVTIQVLLPELLNYAADKVTKLDISFLKDSFTKEQLAYDVKLVATLIVPAINAELVSLAFGKKINELTLHFDIYSEMLENIETSNVLNMKWADIVSLLTNQVLTKANSRYRVTRDDFADIKFSDEVVALQDVIVETDNLFELLGANCINDVTPIFRNNNYKDIKYSNKNVVGKALDLVDELLDAKTIQALLPTIAYHGSDYLEYKGTDIQFLFANVSQKDLAQDADSIVLTLKDLVSYGIVEFVLHNGAIDITNIDPITNAFETIFGLNIIEGNQEQTIFLLLDKLKISKDGVVLSDIDWDNELEAIKMIVSGILSGLLDYGHETLTVKEVKDYIKSTLTSTSYKELIKSLLKEIKEVLKTVNADNFITIVDALSLSDVFDQIVVPVYNRFVLSRFSGSFKDLLDLTGYTPELIDEDMERATLMVRDFKVAKELIVVSHDNIHNPECVGAVEDFIYQAFLLNVSDLKKQDVIIFLDSVKPDLNFDEIDLTDVDMSQEGLIYSAYAEELLVILFESNYLRVNISHLGNTDLMTAIIDMYNGVVNSSSEIYTEASHWLFNNVIYKLISKVGILQDYKFTDAKINLLYRNIGEMLDAMLDMGVFSNNGVDFTNKENTDRLFVMFDELFIPAGQFATHIRHIKEHIYELGIIPFTYESLSTSHEISSLKTIISSATSFYKEYGIDLRKDVTYITSDEVQESFTALCEDLLEFGILEQLLVPVANGLVKIYTKDVVKLCVLDGVDNYTFINIFLPDAYNILEAANELGLLKGKVEYRDADAIVEFARAVVESESTKDHVGDIMKLVFFAVGIDIRDVDFSDVDWVEELESLENAMSIMKPYLTDLEISNRKSYANEEFLSAVALASPYFEDSKVLPLVIRQVADTINEKAFDGRYAEYVNRLFDTTYTDESLMHDYAYIDDVIGKIIETDYLETGINYANLYPYVDLLEMLFALEYTNGMEATILSAIQRRISVISSYNLDYGQVTDWDDESQKLIVIATEFAELSEIAPFDKLSTEDIQNKDVQEKFIDVIAAMSESVLGQQLLPLAYEDHFESKLGSDEYKNLIDFADPDFTPDMWAEEFSKIFKAYNILTENGFGTTTKFTLTLDETIELMTVLFGTENDPSLGINAMVKDPKYWVTKMVEYDAVELTEGAEANVTSERDWSKEPYRIIDILYAMKPFENTEGKFVYENAYFTTDEEALGTLLLAINESSTIRGSLVQVISNLMDTVSGVENALVGSGAIDDEFYDDLAAYQANKDHYNDEYWTDERILEIARVVAETNA